LSYTTGQTLTLHRYGTNKQFGVGAGTSTTRDKQLTWRHNTNSHCRLRLLQRNYWWQ